MSKKTKHVKWFDCSLLRTITLLYRLLLIIVCLTPLHDENHRSNSSLWSDISTPPPPPISHTVIVPYTELHS